jgi:hypothetical protein
VVLVAVLVAVLVLMLVAVLVVLAVRGRERVAGVLIICEKIGKTIDQ